MTKYIRNSGTIEAYPYELGMEDGFVYDCTYRDESVLKNVMYKLLNSEGDTPHRKTVESLEKLPLSYVVKRPFILTENGTSFITINDYLVIENGKRYAVNARYFKATHQINQ